MATSKTVCRMCTSDKVEVFVSLLDSVENKRSSSEILQTLAGVQAAKKDGRSTKVCVTCFSKLESYEKLRRTVVDAQGKLYGPKAIDDLKYLVPSGGKKQNKNIDETVTLPDIRCRQCLSTFSVADYEAHVCNIHMCFQCRSKYSCKCQDENKGRKGRKRAKLMETVTCHHCDLEFPDADAMVAHLTELARCSIFSCKYCPSYFDEHGKLKQHVEDEHTNNLDTTNTSDNTDISETE